MSWLIYNIPQPSKWLLSNCLHECGHWANWLKRLWQPPKLKGNNVLPLYFDAACADVESCYTLANIWVHETWTYVKNHMNTLFIRIHLWIHIHMNSYNQYMNSYMKWLYKFIVYMNSYMKWLYGFMSIWIFVYEFKCIDSESYMNL